MSYNVEKSQVKFNKTDRILSVYHLFMHCQEVSYQEITNLMPICIRTARRYILTLIKAGVLKTEFSDSDNAYQKIDLTIGSPQKTDNPKEQKELVRIHRLCFMMKHFGEWDDSKFESPYEWYKRSFSDTNDKKCREDYAVLNKIGYEFWDNYETDDCEIMMEIASVDKETYVKEYCDGIRYQTDYRLLESAYCLNTFTEDKFGENFRKYYYKDEN